MNNKLIFVPFAYDLQKRTGMNMEHVKDSYTIYCKNFCTALATLKHDNVDCDVALVTNSEPPEIFKNILKRFDVDIHIFSFDSFVFCDDYPWSLAFYKLSALRSVVTELNYDYYCYLDADVISNRPLSPIWEECSDHILMYDVNEGLSVSVYRKFLEEIIALRGYHKHQNRYGGEFFAASKANALLFSDICLQIYKEILEKNHISNCGDEFILSLAASKLPNLIKNASGYTFRYETGQFYLISTRHLFNPVSVLHLPTEKNRGILKIYDRYISKGRLPDKKTIYRICNLNRPYYMDSLKTIIKRLIGKL